MERKEISPAWLVGAGVVLLALLGFWLFRATGPAEPPANSYTPGVPPWMEKGGTASQSGVHQAPGTPQTH